MKKWLFLIIILSLIALWPFFRKGFFESHDGEWMIIRFTAFHQTLASGQFPVRFVDRLNNNYGYPVLNFLYPLPFYLAEIPKVLGFNFIDSIKLVFILSSVSSVVAMFWALYAIFDKKASFAGAILYLYVPYRFVDLYVRGSIGESLAFLFVPLIAGSIFRVAKGQKVYLPPLAIFTALLILSHNVIAVLFLPFFASIIFLLLEKDKKEAVFAFILGIAISAFFWFPAIFDLRYVKLSQIKIGETSEHLVDFKNLIIPSWGYGPTPSGNDALPVQLGIVSIFVLLASSYLHFRSKVKNSLITFQLLTAAVTIFLLTKFSLPVWQTIPFISIIQFPWRMISMVVFIAAFLAAFVVSVNPKKNMLILIVVLAATISTITYTKPRKFIDRQDSYYSTNEDSTTVQNEYLPLWVKQKPNKRANQKIVIEGEILSSEIKSAKYKAAVNVNQDSQVIINTIYFPGWQAQVDGNSVPIDYNNEFGLINFKLPKGTHQVIIKYARSPVHLASEIVSLFALLVTGIYFYRLWTKRNS